VLVDQVPLIAKLNRAKLALSLDFVLGLTPTSGVHVLPSTSSSSSSLSHSHSRLCYVADNVAVLYDVSSKSQTLLRAHRNRISSSALSPCGRVLATACAGSDSSIVFWFVSGQSTNGKEIKVGEALSMIESPHELGTASLDFSACGKYLATLSKSSISTSLPSSLWQQEVAIWHVSNVLASIDSDDIQSSNDENDTLSPNLLCRSTFEKQTSLDEPHTSISVSPFPTPSFLSVGRFRDPPALGSGLLTDALEIVTTGARTIGFWCATCVAVKDEEAGAELRRALKARLPPGVAPSEADLAAVAEAARSATKDFWRLVHSSPNIPGLPVELKSHRLLTCSSFLAGSKAPALTTMDATVQSFATIINERGDVTMTGIMGNGKKPKPKEMMLPPTGSKLVAATSTGDGSLILWRISTSISTTANEHGFKSIAAAAAACVQKESFKVVKLTKPESLVAGPVVNSSLSTISGWTPESLNLVRTTPSGMHAVVGSEDGAVRIYDLNMRLVGHFENISAGPIASLSFVQLNDSGKAQTQTGALNDSSRRHQDAGHISHLSDEVPDIVLSSKRSLVVALSMSSFDINATQTSGNSGDILLEGPDSRVTAMIAMIDRPVLALALSSGCIQLWDAESGALLLVRELERSADQRNDPLTGAPRPKLYDPTCLASDPRGRYIAVGTSDGYILILDPNDLSDVQAVLTPPHWPRNKTSDGAVTRIAFSADGYHLASSDEGRHVSLYRFTRSKERRLIPGADTSTVQSRLASRRPWETLIDDSEKYEEVLVDGWNYISRAKCHSREIRGLSFSALPVNNASPSSWNTSPRGSVPGLASTAFWPAGVILGDRAISDRHAAQGLCMLTSVGHDGHLVVYDVGASSVSSGLQIRSNERSKVEKFASPTATVSLPIDVLSREGAATEDSTGGRVLIATDDYKFKLFRLADGIHCVSTVLAPAFGGALTSLSFLGQAGQHFALAYSTSDRVVGIVALPLTGNPFAALGVVGHSGPVNSLATQFDGKRFFTSGVSLHESHEPGCVCVWSVSEKALNEQIAVGGTGVNSFLNLLDSSGGESGSKYAEICDVFSYAQVHAQGENSSLPRMAGTSIPSSELASVMRALGFFPTAEELNALVNESNHASSSSSFSQGESSEHEQQSSSGSVDLSTLVKLYINHRPILAPTRDDLIRALEIIIQHPLIQNNSSNEDDSSNFKEPSISWKSLKQILATGGDTLSANEAQTCLSALLGDEGTSLNGDDVLSITDFVTKVLRVEQ
jgi:hypothetical protein